MPSSAYNIIKKCNNNCNNNYFEVNKRYTYYYYVLLPKSHLKKVAHKSVSLSVNAFLK